MRHDVRQPRGTCGAIQIVVDAEKVRVHDVETGALEEFLQADLVDELALVDGDAAVEAGLDVLVLLVGLKHEQ